METRCENEKMRSSQLDERAVGLARDPRDGAAVVEADHRSIRIWTVPRVQWMVRKIRGCGASE